MARGRALWGLRPEVLRGCAHGFHIYRSFLKQRRTPLTADVMVFEGHFLLRGQRIHYIRLGYGFRVGRARIGIHHQQ